MAVWGLPIKINRRVYKVVKLGKPSNIRTSDKGTHMNVKRFLNGEPITQGDLSRVVLDNETIMQLYSSVLKRAGYSVRDSISKSTNILQ